MINNIFAEQLFLITFHMFVIEFQLGMQIISFVFSQPAHFENIH